MDTQIVVAALGLAGSVMVGLLSLVGVVISNNRAAQRTTAEMDKRQAVSDTKIEELTREVRAHNNFAQRLPAVEGHIKDIDRRLSQLEEYHRPD